MSLRITSRILMPIHFRSYAQLLKNEIELGKKVWFIGTFTKKTVHKR